MIGLLVVSVAVVWIAAIVAATLRDRRRRHITRITTRVADHYDRIFDRLNDR